MEKTCFVIIGYGIKTDYSTGREIDLDKTFKNIIEPVFKDLGFICYRASDIQHSGVIDIPMYENILKADFVVADLTTLNPNVLYELGIRHAVRKNTTIIISEKELKYPFDLSHILIDSYEHLGKAIDYDEVMRFQSYLRKKVNSLLESPKIDSPIYSLFPNLNVPTFTMEEIEEIKEQKEAEKSVSELIYEAEIAKEKSDYARAILFLEKAIKITPLDDFIIQRLALSTYKAKQPNALIALNKAENILKPLNPEQTTDVETLGLSGAINKRLYEELGDENYLNKSLWYYEKGFYIRNDYYNGINAAFVLTLKSVLVEEKFEAIAYFGRANIIRKQVIEICQSIITSKIWEERDDKPWVMLTLAEAYFGLEMKNFIEEPVAKAKEYLNGNFSIETFLQQQEKLDNALKRFKHKYNNYNV